jgi:hypothetical protein
MIREDEIKAAAREYINREYWAKCEKTFEVTDPQRERDFCEGARWALRQLQEKRKDEWGGTCG